MKWISQRLWRYFNTRQQITVDITNTITSAFTLRNATSSKQLWLRVNPATFYPSFNSSTFTFSLCCQQASSAEYSNRRMRSQGCKWLTVHRNGVPFRSFEAGTPFPTGINFCGDAVPTAKQKSVFVVFMTHTRCHLMHQQIHTQNTPKVHSPSPFIITQPKSWYSFYRNHPTEGRRLSRPQGSKWDSKPTCLPLHYATTRQWRQ